MRGKSLSAFVACLLMIACGPTLPEQRAKVQSAPEPAFVIPAEWTLTARAERMDDGGIVIVGETNLPDETKLWVIPSKAQAEVFVRNGSFRTQAFSNRGKPLPPGKTRVTFFAQFNEFWQNDTIRSITGSRGERLKGVLFKKTEPDILDSDVVLDYAVRLEFPPLSRAAEAIAAVKAAVLTVPGSGRSSANVGDTVAFFMRPEIMPCMRARKGWRAKPGDSPNEYLVEFDYHCGDSPGIWAVDLRTRRVRYVNWSGKTMSYLPPDAH